ncbi:MAG: Ig-like domain-containing protein, partial [Patescibacteria group bacterium]
MAKQRSQKLVKLFVLVLGLASLVLIWQLPVLAQAPDVGLQYLTATGLTSTDIRVVVANIIRYALGLLGIIAVVICIYGGVVWMTSQGNEEKITTAKKILLNGLIGLVIILLSFAIVTWIIGALLKATGQSGEPCQTPGDIQDCSLSPGCPGQQVCQQNGYWGTCQALHPEWPECNPYYYDYLRITYFSPKGALPIRNVSPTLIFNLPVKSSTVSADTIRIADIQSLISQPGFSYSNLTASDVFGQPAVAGAYLTDYASVTFEPDTPCPGYPDRKCFEANNAYGVAIQSGLLSTENKTLQCTTENPCVFYFITGDAIDVQGPVINFINPTDGQSVCNDNYLDLETRVQDDGGIRYIEYRAYDQSGNTIPIVKGNPPAIPDQYVYYEYPESVPPYPLDYTFTQAYWDVIDLAPLTRPKVTAKVYDIDANDSTQEVSIIIRPPHCCNGDWDKNSPELEEGTDCGGPDCGLCDGANCDANKDDQVCDPLNYLCSSNFCNNSTCLCQSLPIISQIDLPDGKPGNFVTIFGANFGNQPGQVYFSANNPAGKVQAQFPAQVNADCGNSWRDQQIIVVVPTDAIDGPVQVVTAAGLWDWTNERAPFVDDFDVNNITRPGVCQMAPDYGTYQDESKIIGIQLGTGQGMGDRIAFGGVNAFSWRDWTDKSVYATVPNVQEGEVTVKAYVGSESSNGFNFNVQPVGIGTGPYIEYVTPFAGPIGQYVTITGRNFGSATGTVYFFVKNDLAKSALADVSFPAACANNYWQDYQIIVKVPATLDNGDPVVYGDYLIMVERNHDGANSNYVDFTVNNAAPTPGVCLLEPNNGPEDTEVLVFGENFGPQDANSKAKFWNEVPGPILVWNESVKTKVPASATSGNFNIVRSGTESNPLDFRVGSCSGQESCNGVPVYTCTGELNGQRGGLDNCWLCSSGAWQWDDAGGTLAMCKDKPFDCCPNGVCKKTRQYDPVEGIFKPISACQTNEPMATYAWSFSTGDVPNWPEVIIQCDRNLNCLFDRHLPSPSPRTPEFDDVLGFERACVNAIITARFTVPMDPTTFSSNTVQVRKCTGTLGTGDQSKPEAEQGAIICSQTDPNLVYGTIELVTSDAFEFTPTNLLAKDTYYQVTLTSGLKSLEGYSLRSEFVWRFKTRDDVNKCSVGCVEVIPDPYEAAYAGLLYWDYPDNLNPLYHRAGADSEDNACILLNPADYNWSWSLSDNVVPGTMPPANYVSLNTVSNPTPPPTTFSYLRQANILDNFETPPDKPVKVWAQEVQSGHKDSARLGINFVDPKVIAKWPDCQTACVNAEIGAAFNTFMKPEQLESLTNVKFYACIDATCSLSGMAQVPIINLSYHDDPNPAPGFYAHEMSFAPASTYNNGLLQVNTYYRVVISGNVQSTSGINLTELNYSAGGLGNDSFSWIFKVKNDQHLCAIDRVGVSPSSKIMRMIPQQQMYWSKAFGALDDCNPFFGQRLNSYAYAWGWRERDVEYIDELLRPVATVTSRTGCGNGFREPGEDCDDGNIDDTDSCRVDCTNSGTMACTPGNDENCCGNNYRDPGEECDYGDPADPNISALYTKFRCSPASCLNLGNTNYNLAVCGNGILEPGEGCDNGTEPNGNLNDGCNDDCTNTGSIAGKSVCGDGHIGFAEECETCYTCSGGSQCQSLLVAACQADPICASTQATIPSYTCLGGGACTGLDMVACQQNPVCTLDITNNSTFCVNNDLANGYTPANGDGCTNRCLLEKAGGSLLNLGNENWGTPVCYNGRVERGEDCDYGSFQNNFDHKCSANCLNIGTSSGGELPGPFQIGESKNEGIADIIAGAGGVCSSDYTISCSADDQCTPPGCDKEGYIEGAGELAVVCGFSDAQCYNFDSTYGADSRGCCRLRPLVEQSSESPYPPQFAQDVCRNTMISVIFDQPMAISSFTGEVEVLTNGVPEPMAYNNQTDQAPRGFLAQLYDRVVGWFRKVFLREAAAQATWYNITGSTTGKNIYDLEGNLVKSELEFYLQQVLPSNADVRVIVHGDVKNKYGVTMSPDTNGDGQADGNYEWQFKTGSDICMVSGANLNPSDVYFNAVDQFVDFEIETLSTNGQQIVPIVGVYSWGWNWELNASAVEVSQITQNKVCNNNIGGPDCAGDGDCINGGICTPRPVQTLTPKNKDGEGALIGSVKIIEDQISNTEGTLFSDEAPIIVFICNNPWPEMEFIGNKFNFPFEDSPENIFFSSLLGTNYTRFRTYYCRDAGAEGDTTDDLPALKAVKAQFPGSNPNLIRHVLLIRDTDPGANFDDSSDAIFITIEKNLEHLSPAMWYGQKFSGQPTPGLIDGYQTLQEGSTYYISAGNWLDAGAGFPNGALFTNMYMLAMTDNANANTNNIFGQLMTNLSFTVNVGDKDSQYCADSSGNRMYDVVKNCSNSPTVECASDADCLIGEDQGTCVVKTTPIACSKDFDCYRCDASAICPAGTTCVTPQLCEVDQDCPGLNCVNHAICQNQKAKITRDIKRAADIHEMRSILATYFNQMGNYPLLAEGTYVPNQTFSVWPSWQATLANNLNTSLPVDPINQFMGCFDPAHPDKWNRVTCWDNKALEFGCPLDSYAYIYKVGPAGKVADITARMEAIGTCDPSNPYALWDCSTYELYVSG